MAELFKKPTVNLGQIMNLLNSESVAQSRCDCKDTHVGRLFQCQLYIVAAHLLVLYKSVHTASRHTQAFLYRLLKSAANSHHLTDGLHRRTDFTADAMEFAHVPTWNLTYYIVQCRLKESRCGLGNRIL